MQFRFALPLCLMLLYAASPGAAAEKPASRLPPKSSSSDLTVQLAGMDMTPREFTFVLVRDHPDKLDHVAHQDFVHGGHVGGAGGFHH